MSYIINKWDGTEWSVIQDGTVDQTLDIKLIGKNYAGYGEIQNENFLHMLENFARSTQPLNAITGQVWYDTANKKLRVFTGEYDTNNNKIWKSAIGAEFSDTAPINPTTGDLWFDTAKDQLKVKTETVWLSIGPQNAGTGLTQMVSLDVLDTDGNTHAIIAATINDTVVYVISDDEFRLTLDVGNQIIGFNTETTNLIKKGITLSNTDSITGVSKESPTYSYWGTAGNALRLAGKPASDYITSENSIFTNKVTFYDPGFTVGDGQDLKVWIESGIDPIVESLTGPRVIFRVKDGSTTKNPVTIEASGLTPGVNNTFTLGTVTKQWSNVYASTFTGTATQANTLRVGTEYKSTSVTAVADTIAVRDGNNYLYATQFKGTADKADQLTTPRTINGVNFDGTGNITIEDSTKLPTAGGTLTGFLTLHADPTANYHSATKQYVDNKFGVGGILGISSGGTNAGNAADARTNLNVPSRTGSGASGTWTIDVNGNATTATTATNIAGGAQGSIPFQTSAGTTSLLNIGTAGQILVVAGNVPQWKSVDLVAVGAASKVAIENMSSSTETYYVTFVNGTNENRSVYVDDSTFTYNPTYNLLTVGRVSGEVAGNVIAPDGTGVILNRGTGDGTNATFSGRAASATKLFTARTISLTGDLTGSASFDGSQNIEINATLGANSIALGSDTTGNYIAGLTAGTAINITNGSGEGVTATISVNASTNDAGTVVLRDANGDFSARIITATLFDGVASSAKYADLAEKYLPDADYEPGTVVSVGGEKEITASVWGDRALGVISTAPAYMMNKDLEGGVYVALKGRVPCKVVGAVRKGQRLVASNNGCAVAAVPHANDVFAIALESSDETGVKVIEVVVL